MKNSTKFSNDLFAEIRRSVATALREDIGTGDLSALLAEIGHRSRATITAREEGILCGVDWFNACYTYLDASSAIKWYVKDGEKFGAGQVLCEVVADTRALLSAERSSLNFLQLLSGTSSITSKFVQSILMTRSKIVDTRKTIPGLRLAQKYAVHCGGGHNHRIGLYDGILIKENHIAAAGSISAALDRARSLANPSIFIMLEVENLDELDQGLQAGATMILLDNMSIADIAEGVRRTNGRAILEASGGITLTCVRDIAETGVDRIAVGCITKDIRTIDLSMRLSPK